MTVGDHLSKFDDLPVVDFLQSSEAREPLPPAASVAWRVATAFEEAPLDEVFESFLREVDTSQVTSLVIGYWGASYDSGTVDPVGVLVNAAGRLPNLRALFLGDIMMEEAEISWIEHSDITPMFTAFPGLKRFELRGAQGLTVEPIRSEALRVLRFESGGLPAAVVRAVAASDLPNLEHLDLWLGIDTYGGDATVADLAPILGGERLPALRHLGLEDSQIQDGIAAAVAGAPVVARLESLSLAMGMLTDEGAEALLSGQPLTHLKKLDLHHHFLSDRMVERIRAALPGVAVDLSEQEKPDGDWHYVAVAE
jgi:hypothetical protein